MDKKKIFIGIAAVFLGWWFISNPSGMSGTVSDLAGGIWTVTTSVFTSVVDVINNASH